LVFALFDRPAGGFGQIVAINQPEPALKITTVEILLRLGSIFLAQVYQFRGGFGRLAAFKGIQCGSLRAGDERLMLLFELQRR